MVSVLVCKVFAQDTVLKLSADRDDGTFTYYVTYDDPRSPYDHKYFYKHFRNPTQTRLELGWHACSKTAEERDDRETWLFVNEIEPYVNYH